MLRRALAGLAAGAAGTAALNLVTYLDMLARGRPASDVPARTVETLAEAAGMEISGPDQAATEARRTAAGSVMGYGAGLGVGMAYGIGEAAIPDLPVPLSGALLGGLVMATSDATATATGSTDPRNWGAVGWLADLVPHLVYGIVAVSVFRALRS